MFMKLHNLMTCFSILVMMKTFCEHLEPLFLYGRIKYFTTSFERSATVGR